MSSEWQMRRRPGSPEFLSACRACECLMGWAGFSLQLLCLLTGESEVEPGEEIYASSHRGFIITFSSDHFCFYCFAGSRVACAPPSLTPTSY